VIVKRGEREEEERESSGREGGVLCILLDNSNRLSPLDSLLAVEPGAVIVELFTLLAALLLAAAIYPSYLRRPYLTFSEAE
jgi:hypothetical protein